MKLGDKVSCRYPVTCYDNKTTFQPGMVGVVTAIMPKVRIVKCPPHTDGKPHFLVVDFIENGMPQRVGLNYCNVKMCG